MGFIRPDVFYMQHAIFTPNDSFEASTLSFFICGLLTSLNGAGMLHPGALPCLSCLLLQLIIQLYVGAPVLIKCVAMARWCCLKCTLFYVSDVFFYDFRS